ncbi:MAG: hypothetical protein ABIE94_01980, partial [archaeon]
DGNISVSEILLLSGLRQATNNGSYWNHNETVLNFTTGTTMIEPVNAQVTLIMDRRSEDLVVFPLDNTGQPTGREVPVDKNAYSNRVEYIFLINGSIYDTIWYWINHTMGDDCIDMDGDRYNGSGDGCGPVDCDDDHNDDLTQYTASQISQLDTDSDGNVAEHIHPGGQSYCGNSVDEDCDTTDPTCSNNDGGGGGGSSGGGVPILPCLENWTCSNWFPCFDGIQLRRCEDLNNCSTNESMPILEKDCEISEGLENGTYNVSINESSNITAFNESIPPKEQMPYEFRMELPNLIIGSLIALAVMILGQFMAFRSFKKRKMMDIHLKDLDEYIRKSLLHGNNLETVVKKLVKSNWPEKLARKRVKLICKK